MKKYKNKQKAIENQKNKVKSTLSKIVELFQSGNVPEKIAVATYSQYADTPSAKWSLGNRLIMLAHDTSDARGYKQWAEEGRQVKKGEKSFSILAPKMVKKTKKDENGKEIKTENPEFFCAGFMPISVFRVEQTEGEKLNYQPHQLPELPLMEKAREWGIDVKAETFSYKYYGYYQKGESEKIRLATPSEKTFFHELAHAAHDRIRQGKKERLATKEIVAELSAQALCYLVGTKASEGTEGNSFEYIERYAKELKKDVGTACISVLAEVEKVLNLILEPVKEIPQENVA